MVLEKLESEMNSHENSIFALQEVSYDWAGTLHTFFCQKGYHLVTGLYGKPFNGYMGVCLAWPTNKFNVVDVDISRVSDKREGGWPADEGVSLTRRMISGVQGFLDRPLKLLGMASEEKIDHWKMAERRFNVLVSAKLEEVDSKRTFAVSTYHMPCAFYAPMVMTIHCDLAARHVQKFADGVPYLFAGDFNIKPSDACYKFMTTGAINDNDPFFPTPKSGFDWKPQSDSMDSAYHLKNGNEPDFTNYAKVGEKEPFIDTLDYIFLSKGKWNVVDLEDVPTRHDVGGPLPNLDRGEPSDHVLIAASLELQT